MDQEHKETYQEPELIKHENLKDVTGEIRSGIYQPI